MTELTKKERAFANWLCPASKEASVATEDDKRIICDMMTSASVATKKQCFACLYPFDPKLEKHTCGLETESSGFTSVATPLPKSKKGFGKAEQSPARPLKKEDVFPEATGTYDCLIVDTVLGMIEWLKKEVSPMFHVADWTGDNVLKKLDEAVREIREVKKDG